MHVLRSTLLGVVTTSALSAQNPTAPAAIIGGEENRGAELGTIQHVLVLPSRLVVIDGSAPFYRVFDHTGRLVQSFGQAGSGPGEYRAVDAIAYDSASREVWVYDRRLARLTRFAAGDTLRPIASHQSSVTSVSALCAMNGRFYALSAHGGRFVHELAVQENRIESRRSYGEPKTARDVAANPGLRNNSANGALYCDAPREVVYAGATLYGEIHRVDLQTGTHTFTPIPAFVGMEFRPNGDAVMMSMPARGWVDRIVDLRMARGGVEVVLAASPAGPGRSPFSLLTLTSAGAASARVAYAWRPLGRAGGRVVCSTDDPAPTIAFFALERCP